MVVSTVNSAGGPEEALMGFACTQKNEFVFDTLSTSRKAINLAGRPATALVIGWDDNNSVQIEGDARQRLRQREAARRPVQEPRIQPLFQPVHVLAARRLPNLQCIRGPGEAAGQRFRRHRTRGV